MTQKWGKSIINLWISKSHLFIILAFPLFFSPFLAHADIFANPDNVTCAGTWAPGGCSIDFATGTIGSYVQWVPSGGAAFCVAQSGFDGTGLDFLYTISIQSAPTGVPQNISALAPISTDTGTAVSSFTVSGVTYYVNKYDISGSNPMDGVCVDHTSGGNANTLSFILSSDDLAFTTSSQYDAWVATHENDVSGATRIIDFTPGNNVTLSTTTVNFSLTAYINPDDINTLLGFTTVTVNIKLHNIDQNTLLSVLSPNDIILYQHDATSSGVFSFATTTVLDQGNYRLEATLTKRYLSVFQNPFSSVNTTQSHQFIVGTSTFLGNISQKSFTETQAIFNSFTATSTEALAGTCNVLSGFDVMHCLAFLFIPSGDQLNDSMNSLKDGVLTRVPWGYVTRVYTIMQGNSTSSLPAFSVEVPYDSSADTVHFSLDMNQAFASATTELTTIRDPVHNKNIRDVAEPIVDLIVAFAVLFEIITDVMGSHKSQNLKSK